MEEFDNNKSDDNNKKILILKPFAFDEIKNINEKNKNFAVIDNGNSDSENLSYNDLDFALAKEFSGVIRENNPIRLLTKNLISIFKICKKDYIFEEIEKPRRELTLPNEGKF